MRNALYRNTRTVTCTLFVAAAGMLAAGPMSADPLNRLSADFQNNTSIGSSEILRIWFRPGSSLTQRR
jgi:hypothetical protein